MKTPLKPPWVEYPEYHPLDGFWRLGEGDLYLYAWNPYWAALSEAEKEEVLKQYPKPGDWLVHENFVKFIANEYALQNLEADEEEIVLACLNFCHEEILANNLTDEISFSAKELRNIIDNYQEEKQYSETYGAVRNCLKVMLKNKQNLVPQEKLESIYQKITDGRFEARKVMPEVSFPYRQPYFFRIFIAFSFCFISAHLLVNAFNFGDIFVGGAVLFIPITLAYLRHLYGDFVNKPKIIFDHKSIRFTRNLSVNPYTSNKPKSGELPAILPKKLTFHYMDIEEIKKIESWFPINGPKKLKKIIIYIRLSYMGPYELIIGSRNLPEGGIEEIDKILQQRIEDQIYVTVEKEELSWEDIRKWEFRIVFVWCMLAWFYITFKNYL